MAAYVGVGFESGGGVGDYPILLPGLTLAILFHLSETGPGFSRVLSPGLSTLYSRLPSYTRGRMPRGIEPG